MQPIEIVVIIACVFIVGAVVITSVINRIKGKNTCCDCASCNRCCSMKLKDNIKAKAIKLLSEDILYIDMLCGIEQGIAEVTYADTDGVIVYFPSSEIYGVATLKPSFMGKLDKLLVNKWDCLELHDKETLEYFSDKIKKSKIVPCYNVVYDNKDYVIEKDFEIKPLTMEQFDTVINTYNRYPAEEEIKKNIAENKMFGAFIQGKMAGFIGVHEEGSIGMLEVLPEYRRKGVGSALTLFMANLYRQKGFTPFCQIIFDNEKSINLHKKFGCKFSERLMYWFVKIY